MIVTVTPNPAVDETLTVHQLQLGETNRIKATEIDPGGKGLNVARMVKRLGRPVVAILILGGETGGFIRARLEREDVDMDSVWIEEPTRVNISVLDDSSGQQTNLNHEGPAVTGGDLHALEHKIQEWLSEAVVMTFGGSLPPGAPADTYARLIRWVCEGDVKSILDASGDALAEGIKAKPYLIKPNLREVEALLGRSLKSDDDATDAGYELIDRGIHTVVISMGAKGAVGISREGTWKVTPPDVQVRSTLGAGDSMVAGLAIGIYEHLSLADGLALGTAAAAATVMSPGTALGRAEDIQELLPRVRVEQLR